MNQKFTARNVSNTTKTIAFVGCSHELSEKKIRLHLTGVLTVEIHGSNCHLNHYICFSCFKLLDETQMETVSVGIL